MADLWLLIRKKDAPYESGAKAGDIVEAVVPDYPLRDHEKAQYLIIPVTGMSINDIGILTSLQWSNGSDGIPLGVEPAPTIVAKRKHAVPVAQMQIAVPSLDLEKLTDPSIIYQPFLGGYIRVPVKVVNFIKDKHTDTFRKDFS